MAACPSGAGMDGAAEIQLHWDVNTVEFWYIAADLSVVNHGMSSLHASFTPSTFFLNYLSIQLSLIYKHIFSSLCIYRPLFNSQINSSLLHIYSDIRAYASV